MNNQEPKRFLFMHGRPSPHPFHATLANSIDADFIPCDFYLRWHDRQSVRLKRYISSLICGIFIPEKGKYNAIITEGIQFPPLVAKKLDLLKSDQKILALLDNEALYFIKSRYYPQSTIQLLIHALSLYDGLICIGEMQTQMAKDILSAHRLEVGILTINSAVETGRINEYKHIVPNIRGQSILFIGNGPNGFRGWYKGIDILINMFKELESFCPRSVLNIVGTWDERYITEKLFNGSSDDARINFIGKIPDLKNILSDSSLYVHLARGEAWGISVLEAMCAGIPAIVSEWTGAKEAVAKVDPQLIVPLNVEKAIERVQWYFSLPYEKKQFLSQKSREVAIAYTEEKSIIEFKEKVYKFIK